MIKLANDHLERNGEFIDKQGTDKNYQAESKEESDKEEANKEEMEESLEDVLSCLDTTYEEYVPGEAVIHSGSVIHSVAPWHFTSSDYKDARVTLQGFAFLCDGAWYLHW